MPYLRNSLGLARCGYWVWFTVLVYVPTFVLWQRGDEFRPAICGLGKCLVDRNRFKPRRKFKGASLDAFIFQLCPVFVALVVDF